MAHVIVIGAGIGGMCAAYELRAAIGGSHAITVVGEAPSFSFTPSNPWVAIGWRKPSDIQVEVAPALGRRDIGYIDCGVAKVLPQENRVELKDGRSLAYDYLVITTGPRLAFDEVPGLGPHGGHTQSVCTTPHAQDAWANYEAFVKNPGPVVIGAAQGASCFGPAYEFALMLDTDLRRRKIRDRVPMTFITSEPYIGHMGLGGVGDSRGLLERQFRQRHIRWITSSKIEKIEDGQFHVSTLDSAGKPAGEQTLPFAYSMIIPAFTGVDAVRGVEGLVNPRGFVLIDKHQRNPTYRNVFSAGVCVAIPPVEVTPVPTGAPKTGFMIESMVSTLVANLKADLEGREGTAEATWNAVCLADMGDSGAAFVALPQIPPRNVTWAREGKWVHVAKVAYEKYFLRKMRAGTSEPLYERYVMKALGIERIKPGTGKH
ncbi:NAD(P)/FAD-dependent oxidoreductase [Dyella ginsengisoli]|uniref:NAD(P)/FAD-dependent oxidoreductase n=1 Tax=Dyella ginsengisoli TaxID=363848 RepID=UPI0003474719|nr:FAD/NAD(P)-binding oxidoreductase [Dyella ginsengisoli]